MWIYWFLFTLLLIFSQVEVNNKCSNASNYYRFLFILFVLFCLGFLRWERGTDWDSYYNQFLHGTSIWDEHSEVGYVLLNDIIRYLTDSYTIFLFVEGLIYCFFFVDTLRKLNTYLSSKYNNYIVVFCPILLYMYSQDFACIFLARSPIAYMICLNAVMDILSRKKYLFILKVIVAFTIHRSSLLFLFIYPLCVYFKFSLRTVILFLVISVFVFSISAQYADILQLLNFGDYNEYLNSLKSANYIGIIKWSFILVFICYLRRDYKDPLYDIIIIIYAIGVMLYTWSQFYAPVAQRLAALFLNVSYLWIAYVLQKPISSRKMNLFIISIICGLSLWSSLVSDYGKLFYPFKFVWDDFYVETSE